MQCTFSLRSKFCSKWSYFCMEARSISELRILKREESTISLMNIYISLNYLIPKNAYFYLYKILEWILFLISHFDLSNNMHVKIYWLNSYFTKCLVLVIFKM